jgi:hypothetical protein
VFGYLVDSEGFIIDNIRYNDEIDTIEGNLIHTGIEDGFSKPKWDFVLKQWVESENPSVILERYKQEKIKRLDQQCNSSILNGFTSVVNGIEYGFSYDMEAQSRFNGVASSFVKGYITEIEWTAYLNGVRTAIVLNESDFDIVAKDALAHCNNNIARFREVYALVTNAQTIEEVDSIVW